MYADSGPGELSAHLASAPPLPDRGGAAQTGAGRGGPSQSPTSPLCCPASHSNTNTHLQFPKRLGQLTNHQKQREVVYPLYPTEATTVT